MSGAGEHFDVLVIGAGLSGVGAGCHLSKRCPDRSYAILEGRERLGGTWDLFRYPGIRSDSDMFTLGYAFRPWTQSKAIADGPAILDYIADTARAYGVDRHIRYRHKVVRAEWSTADARWTVTAEHDGAERHFTCSFLYACSGYYNYTHPYAPEFAGLGDYKGELVHPQFWTPDIDHVGKRVVVIGSGATAVTLVPEMAKQAAHVVMLQRSPSYVASRPSVDAIGAKLRRWLPSKLAYGITRWKNVFLQQYFYRLMRRKPEQARDYLINLVREQLGDDYDVGTHFSPTYAPWDQRLCAVPDNDLFEAIRGGKVEMVTDTIDRFTETGIRLGSGREIEADMIVTATGLAIQLLGGMELVVDGEKTDFSKHLMYKGMMISGVPNMALCFGYTNASWTLKADLTSAYVCRLLNAMKRRGMRQATPVPGEGVGEMPFLDFSSGYVQRALPLLPKQGARSPWRLYQNYARDTLALRFGSIDDEMVFSNPEPGRRAA